MPDSNRSDFKMRLMTKKEQLRLRKRLSKAIDDLVEVRDELNSIKDEIETYEYAAHDASELLEQAHAKLSEYL